MTLNPKQVSPAVSKVTVSGPTTLTFGSVSDNQFLKRSGSSIIGATPGGGSFPYLINGYRLSAQSTNPAPESTGNTTEIYLVPWKSREISIYTGGQWTQMTSPSFVTCDLTTLGLSANTNYDFYAYDNSGTLTLGDPSAWTDDTTPPTLAYQDGVEVKDGDPTRRYVGTVRTVSTTETIDDGISKRFIWNQDNRVIRSLFNTEPTASWTFNGTWNGLNSNSAVWKLEFVIGRPYTLLQARAHLRSLPDTGDTAYLSIGFDSNTTPNAYSTIAKNGTTFELDMASFHQQYGSNILGYHFIQGIGQTDNVLGATFSASAFNAGIWAWYES